MEKLKANLENIKIVVTDLDGTLLRNDKTLSPENLQAIKEFKQNNILFAIASGRPIGSVLHQLRGWQLEGLVDYIIHTNGYGYYDYHHQKNHVFDGMKARWCKEIIHNYQDLDIIAIEYDGYHLYTTLINATVERIKSYDHLTPQIVSFDFFTNHDFSKFVISGEKNVIDQVERRYQAIHSSNEYHGFRSANDLFEFVNLNTSKFHAIKKLCEEKYFSLNDILAFGDEENDRLMLSNIPHSVAMNNASKSIKQIAQYTTLTNEENGFAHFINANLLTHMSKGEQDEN